MTCHFMHKNCEKDCDNHECRAFFPEKQPLIDPKSKDMCLGEDYSTECLIYVDGTRWREEKRLKGLTEKCPFASNTICGRPWEWWCKGSNYPFILTPYEIKEGTENIPVRDADKNIKFIPVEYDMRETCISGDSAIYMTCPHYLIGMEIREEYRQFKSNETDKKVGNVVE
jgi:hypothetical protein